MNDHDRQVIELGKKWLSMSGSPSLKADELTQEIPVLLLDGLIELAESNVRKAEAWDMVAEYMTELSSGRKSGVKHVLEVLTLARILAEGSND